MQAIIPIFQSIVEISLFLISGLLISHILAPKQGLLERVVYSLLISIGVTGMTAVVLLAGKVFSYESFVAVLVCLDVVLLLCIKFVILKSKKRTEVFETVYDGDVWIVGLLALAGTMWKVWFTKSLVHVNDPYNYAFSFVGKSVPDLGFYTGMATDRVNYIGLIALEKMREVFLTPYVAVQYFLTTFLFLGLVYLTVMAYRNSKVLARIVMLLLCLGPIELFYAMSSVTGHSLAYVCVLPLFLLFKKPQAGLFVVCVLFVLLMACTYYTATIVILLSSGGFVLATLIRRIIYKTPYVRNVLYFVSIIIITSLFLISNTSMALFSIGKLSDKSDVQIALKAIQSNQLSGTGEFVQNMTIYKDPSFGGLSAIRWQMVFFFLCGCTLFVDLIRRRKMNEEQVSILLALIPVVIVSVSFFYANYPTRIFDYFAFFGLLALYIPRRMYVLFAIFSFMFVAVSLFFVAKDKRIFLSISDGEVKAGVKISQSHKGVIFTDIVFANQLIANGHYEVTGTHDKDALVYNLFYQKDKKVFAEAVSQLHKQGVRFIAITKRMKDQYILMVNYPQQPMVNEELYSKVLPKIFDNGNVQLFLLNADNAQHKR